MASVFRVRATWTGFIGAPGLTQFSFLDIVGTAGADAATAAVRAFFNTQAAAIPALTGIQIEKEVAEHDEVSGQLIGEVVASTQLPQVSGTFAGAYAGGSGMFLGWRTGTIWQGHRVQGRTFMVPTGGIFENNGTLTGAASGAAQSAGDALIADANSVFAIWAKRFTIGTDGKPHQTNGAAFAVTSCHIPDQASQLRSRRL